MANVRNINPKLLASAGTIQKAALQRLGTARTWNLLKEEWAAQGIEFTGADFFGLGTMYSQYTTQRNASESFEKSPGDNAFDRSMISTTFYSRPIEDMNLSQNYQIRTLQTVIENGETVEYWRTITDINPFDYTKDGLLDEINAAALTMANDYNQEHVSTSDYQFLQV